MDGAHIIDVNDLVISMERTRSENKVKFPLLQKMRMPCDADNDVYEPSVVSIGPYHHKAVATLQMQQTKWEALSYILGLNREKTMRDYLEAMAGLEQQIRSCYSSEFQVGSDEFLKMMLLDGCFILCIFYGTSGTQDVYDPATSINVGGSQQNGVHDDYSGNDLDSVYSSKHWCTTIWTHDLVLLQNQIPFFVVMKLFEVVTNGNIPFTILLKNVARFTEDLLISYPKPNFKLDHPKHLHHLLYLCHRYFMPKIHVKSCLDFSTYDYDDGAEIVKLIGWHRTIEYYEAGMEFKKREICSENPHSLLDIAFCDGVLVIPCLTIDPNTYGLLPNLLAFEETCPQFGNYMTSYVVFLSQFITMPEDVSLLTKRGILVDQLDGDAEVSDLFRMLAQGVTFDTSMMNSTSSIFVMRWKCTTKSRDQDGESGLGQSVSLMKVSLITFLEDPPEQFV